MTWSSRSEGLTSSIEALLASLLSTRFPSAAHFRKDWLLDRSLAAKWAWLLITRLIAAYPTHWRSKHNEGWPGLKTSSIELIMTRRGFSTLQHQSHFQNAPTASPSIGSGEFVEKKFVPGLGQLGVDDAGLRVLKQVEKIIHAKKNIVITLAFLSHISLGL